MIPVLIVVCFLTLPAPAQYSGGAGTADDPYQIATAADLIALGETPDDYDKHFILTADIDLDPNLPHVPTFFLFDKAVIAPDTSDAAWGFQGTAFTGVFDGKDHTISHLTITGGGYLGLFGAVVSEAMISNLGLEAVDVNGTHHSVGGLVGYNEGSITHCYTTGTVSGDCCVGGLVGWNSDYANITHCYSIGSVTGQDGVGGLVGSNGGTVTGCHSAGSVTADFDVGGLVGANGSTIISCHSTCDVTGEHARVGGLVGDNFSRGSITACYSTGSVTGDWAVGGLVGIIYGRIQHSYAIGSVTGHYAVGGLVGATTYGGLGEITEVLQCYSTGVVSGDEAAGGLIGGPLYVVVTASFWDVETSGQIGGGHEYEGEGLSTAEMQSASTFVEAGWDFVGETENGTEDIWKIVEGQTYPLLSWQKYGGGTGEPNDPYLIYTAEHLNALGAEPNDYDKHFKLMADIDLAGYVYDKAVIAPDMNDMEDEFQGTSFAGVFDGNNHIISHLTIIGGSQLGLFGQLGSAARVSKVGLEAVDICGTGGPVGGLVGLNDSGSIAASYSTGVVSGGASVGGLVGYNRYGSITGSYSVGTVAAGSDVGGLVGVSYEGNVDASYSAAQVRGDLWYVGGLMGHNIRGSITNSYSTSIVNGNQHVGALVGVNDEGNVNTSYSTGAVSGESNVGGLVGTNAGIVGASCSTGTVSGKTSVGGLVGLNGPLGTSGTIMQCYSTGSVAGSSVVGGLVGYNNVGSIAVSYSASTVSGEGIVGGLVGSNGGRFPTHSTVSTCFWDTETSGLTAMCGNQEGYATGCDASFGKTTAEMQTAATFLEVGWDFVCEVANGTEDIWYMPEGDYPRLVWELEETPLCPAEVIELDAANFDQTIAEGVVLVDFFATWCSHCRTQAPILDEVAEQVRGEAVVGKLDIDQARSLAQRCGVTVIPTLILFKDGEVFERFVGVTQAPVLTAAIRAALAHQEPGA
jgi:thioredoxin